MRTYVNGRLCAEVKIESPKLDKKNAPAKFGGGSGSTGLDDGAGGLDVRELVLPEQDGRTMVTVSERSGAVFTDLDGDGLADHVSQASTEDQIYLYLGWNTSR